MSTLPLAQLRARPVHVGSSAPEMHFEVSSDDGRTWATLPLANPRAAGTYRCALPTNRVALVGEHADPDHVTAAVHGRQKGGRP